MFEDGKAETYYKVGVRTSRVFTGKNKEKFKFSRDFFVTQNETLAKRFFEDAKRNPRENQEPTFEVFQASVKTNDLAFNTEDEYAEFLEKWCWRQQVALRYD